MISHSRPCSYILKDADHGYTSEKHSFIAREWIVVNETITISTREAPHFVDLTEIVQDLIQREGIVIGSALVFSKHTTAAVVVNEHEPLLLEDISELLTRLIPHTEIANYRHDDMRIRTVNLVEDEPQNGHAHCQHLLLGSSIQIPIKAQRLDLGQWQRLFLVELDRSRSRQVVIQISGIQG